VLIDHPRCGRGLTFDSAPGKRAVPIAGPGGPTTVSGESVSCGSRFRPAAQPHDPRRSVQSAANMGRPPGRTLAVPASGSRPDLQARNRRERGGSRCRSCRKAVGDEREPPHARGGAIAPWPKIPPINQSISLPERGRARRWTADQCQGLGAGSQATVRGKPPPGRDGPSPFKRPASRPPPVSRPTAQRGRRGVAQPAGLLPGTIRPAGQDGSRRQPTNSTSNWGKRDRRPPRRLSRAPRVFRMRLAARLPGETANLAGCAAGQHIGRGAVLDGVFSTVKGRPTRPPKPVLISLRCGHQDPEWGRLSCPPHAVFVRLSMVPATRSSIVYGPERPPDTRPSRPPSFTSEPFGVTSAPWSIRRAFLPTMLLDDQGLYGLRLCPRRTAPLLRQRRGGRTRNDLTGTLWSNTFDDQPAP